MVKKVKERAAIEAEVDVEQIDLFARGATGAAANPPSPSPTSVTRRRSAVTTSSTRWTTTTAMKTKMTTTAEGTVALGAGEGSERGCTR